MALKRAGIKKLKAHLSAYVRAAAKGDRVLITDRGQVVAEIVPHTADAEVTLIDRILKMAKEGTLRLTPGFPDKMPHVRLTPVEPKISRETLQQWHDEDREDRF